MAENQSSPIRVDQLAGWNVNKYVVDTNNDNNNLPPSLVLNLKMFGGSAQPSLFLVWMMTSYSVPGVREWKVKVNMLSFCSMVGMMLVQSDVSA
jgi:hypothetical protein